MLEQVSQVDGNIQNNASTKSQVILPQASRHQTPNTFINILDFQMPQYGAKINSMWVFLKVLQLQEKRVSNKNEKPFDNTHFTNNCVHMTYGVNPK